jgi:hypothetical protein
MCRMSGEACLQIGIETELRCHRLRASENGSSATGEQQGLIRPLPEAQHTPDRLGQYSAGRRGPASGVPVLAMVPDGIAGSPAINGTLSTRHSMAVASGMPRGCCRAAPRQGSTRVRLHKTIYVSKSIPMHALVNGWFVKQDAFGLRVDTHEGHI